MLIIPQTNTPINPTVVQKVSKNVKHKPNVNPFMSQFMWNIFSIVNKKRNKNDLFTVWCEQLCDCAETSNLSSLENTMKISVIQNVYYNIDFITKYYALW